MKVKLCSITKEDIFVLCVLQTTWDATCFQSMTDYNLLFFLIRFTKMLSIEYAHTKIKVHICSNEVEPMDKKAISAVWAKLNVTVIYDSGLEWGSGETNSGKLSTYSGCGLLFDKRMFQWNGDFNTCCFDFNGINCFGNILTDTWVNAVKRLTPESLPFCNTCPFKGSLLQTIK